MPDGSAFTLSPLHTFASLLTEASATKSKKDKQAIVGRFISANGESIKHLLRLSLSPYITFGVKKWPESLACDPNLYKPAEHYELALKLLDRLAKRELTGNEATSSVSMLLSLFPDDGDVSVREALRRVILKDLRADFSESTVNKAAPGTIPVFECQLAASEMPNLDDLKYPVLVEPKYDGVRTIAMKRNGVVTLYSRNGIPFENFEELREVLTGRMMDNCVLDGEILHAQMLGDEGFKRVMKRAKADPGKNVVENPIRYQVFDAMALEQWDKQSCPHDQLRRRQFVEAHVQYINVAHSATATPGKVCENATEVQSYYQELVDKGFEGVIIKKVDATYDFKRSKTWQKLKPFDTIDLKIVGTVGGTGKYEGMLGALVCEGTHEGKTIHTEVGSGFTDADRRADWPIGSNVEVRYQDITLADGSSVHALRFPTYVRRRAADAGGKV
jgi:DNA ligase-1